MIISVSVVQNRTVVDSLLIPSFFLVSFAILKDFLYLFGAKFTGRKFHQWRHDNWSIGEWGIFDASPDTAYVNLFYPREFIIWFKSIQAKQVDLATVPHWSLLLRNYERLTWVSLCMIYAWLTFLQHVRCMWLCGCVWSVDDIKLRINRPFYRYGGHIELIRLKEYYRMPRGHEHISFVFLSAFRDIFS